MGKISLRGLFVRYLRTLHSVDDDSLYIPDVFVHFAIPFGLFIWAIIDTHSAAAVRAYFANAMTAISVISGFMCGLAIMIFELRINLNQSNGELGENAHEIELIDELFLTCCGQSLSAFCRLVVWLYPARLTISQL